MLINYYFFGTKERKEERLCRRAVALFDGIMDFFEFYFYGKITLWSLKY